MAGTPGEGVQAHALQADEGGQVDVGIELRLGDIDVLAGGLHPPALRHHVRTMTEQVSGEIARDAEIGGRFELRRLDAAPAVGPLADQGRQAVVTEFQGLLEGDDPRAGCSDARFGLLDVDLAVQLRGKALLGERVDALLLIEHLLFDGQLVIGRLQVDIGLDDAGRQHQTSGVLVDLGGPAAAHRGFYGRLVPAPEIQLVAAIEHALADVLPGARHGGGCGAIGAVALPDDRQGATHLGHEARFLEPLQGFRLAHAGGCCTQAGCVLQRLGYQGVQLCVREPRPPIGLRPVGGRNLDALQGLDSLEIIRIDQARLRLQVAERAAGNQQRAQNGGGKAEGAPPSGDIGARERLTHL
ncbi:hypothetical protein D3C78_1098620 [compost metagenome]